MSNKYLYGHLLDQELVDKVFQDLKKKYSEGKSKKFVEMLIKSFLPINSNNLIYEFGKDTERVCCLTKNKLASLKDVFNLAKISGVDQSLISNGDILCTDEGIKEFEDKIQEYTSKEKVYWSVKTRNLAFSSPKTSKVLSIEAISALGKFVDEELNKGNRSIKFLVNKNKSIKTSTSEKIKKDKINPKNKKNSISEDNLDITKKSGTKFNSFEDLKSLLG